MTRWMDKTAHAIGDFDNFTSEKLKLHKLISIFKYIVKDDLALLIAYHSTTTERKAFDKEYLFTTRHPPLPVQVVWIHRTLGVGKVWYFFTAVLVDFEW
jgi:hypothetical protein